MDDWLAIRRNKFFLYRNPINLVFMSVELMGEMNHHPILDFMWYVS